MNAPLDIAPLVYWIAAFNTIIVLGNTVWMVMSGPTRKLAERLAQTEARLLEVEKRAERHASQLVAVSQTVNGLPGHQALHQLELTLTKMDGEIGKLSAIMDGNTKIMARLEAVVTRHEDHLLDGGKR